MQLMALNSKVDFGADFSKIETSSAKYIDHLNAKEA